MIKLEKSLLLMQVGKDSLLTLLVSNINQFQEKETRLELLQALRDLGVGQEIPTSPVAIEIRMKIKGLVVELGEIVLERQVKRESARPKKLVTRIVISVNMKQKLRISISLN